MGCHVGLTWFGLLRASFYHGQAYLLRVSCRLRVVILMTRTSPCLPPSSGHAPSVGHRSHLHSKGGGRSCPTWSFLLSRTRLCTVSHFPALVVGCTRTLLAAELGGVHGLAEHLDCEPTRLFQVALLLVVLLQQALGRGIVCTDACRLPAAVVATGVALVELELSLGVPSGVDEGHAKGPQTAVLRISLLEIAKLAHELLAGHVFVVGEEVALGGLTGVVDEDVGIGGHTRYSADHVATTELVPPGQSRRHDALVQDVQLLGGCVLLQQLARHLPLRREDNAVLR
jgi:hypothetical protein